MDHRKTLAESLVVALWLGLAALWLVVLLH